MKNQTLDFFAENATCKKTEDSGNSLISQNQTNQGPWPPAGIDWYYSDQYTAIAHGDCREILPHLGPVDLVLTDPPYGIGYKYLSYNDTQENLADLINAVSTLIDKSRNVAVFCGVNNIQKYPTANWIMAWHWRGTNTYGKYGINQWQPVLCYGRDLPGFGSINGVLKSDAIYYEGGNCDEVKRFDHHPCPKNLGIMKRLIARLSFEDNTILDPFMGSGTTLVAAKQLRRKAIGIEIEEKYCEIAKRRLSQEVFDF